MTDALAFWAVAVAIAAFAYPMGAVLLRRLPDAGAGFAFPLGLVLSGYGYFILRVLQLLPPGRGGYVAVVALLGVTGAAVAGRDRWSLVTWRRAWPGMLIAVGVFTLAFFGYLSLRSYNAEIGGTEQPMDLMYLNATMHSEEYPPKDSWLAGERASYYYFGYLQAGLLTSVADVPASTGYNLALAYTFAAGATAAGSLGFALGRWMLGSRRRSWAIAAGATSVVLLLFVGSLAAVFEWTAAHEHYDLSVGPVHPYEMFGAEEIIQCQTPTSENCYRGPLENRTTEWYPTEFWFWFRDTRIIPKTITESPFFSFLLGDLHPHVMSIPLVLLVIGLSLSTWRGRSLLAWQTHLRTPASALALAVILGALAFQNAWDVISFAGVFSVAVLARNLRNHRPVEALLGTGGYVGPLAVGAVVLYLPWLVTFSSQAGGIEPYIGAGTRPGHLVLQFGPIVAAGVAASAAAFRVVRTREALNAVLLAAWLPVAPFVGWILFAWAKGDLSTAVDARTAGGWWTLLVYGVACWVTAGSAAALALNRRAGAAPAALAAVGILLLFGAELFYIKDVFAGGSPRLNTIFKLSYQGWMLLSIAGGAAVMVAFARARTRPWGLALAGPAAVLIVLGLAYPLLSSFNRTEGFDLKTHIDGLAGVQESDPGEYQLVQWIDEHTEIDAVVIEASGRRWSPGANGPTVVDGGSDYSDSGRISGRTGRATPIGWYSHEIQWRGDNPEMHEELRHRQERVDAAYISGDPDTVVDVMREFGAEYLVVGRIELARYPGLLGNFDSFLDVAFRTGNYTIYRLPRYDTVQTS